MADKKNSSCGPYDVGKGKPPREHRFQRGTSGNPNGRPRKSPGEKESPVLSPTTPDQLILQDARKQLKLRTGEGETSMSSMEAVLQATKAAALKGDVGAQRLYTKMANDAEQRDQEVWRKLGELVPRYQERHPHIILELKKRKMDNKVFAPHPDDIRLNEELRCLEYLGPSNFEEQLELDMRVSFRNMLQWAMGYWGMIECDPVLEAYICDAIAARYAAVVDVSALLPERYAVGPLEDFVPWKKIGPHKWKDPIAVGCLAPIPSDIIDLFEANPDVKERFFHRTNFPLGPEQIPINDSGHYRPLFDPLIAGNAKERLLLQIAIARKSRKPINMLVKLVRERKCMPYICFNAAVALSMAGHRELSLILDDFERSL